MKMTIADFGNRFSQTNPNMPGYVRVMVKSKISDTSKGYPFWDSITVYMHKTVLEYANCFDDFVLLEM